MYNKISGFSDEIHSAIDVQFQVLNKLDIEYFEPRGIDGKNISTLTDEEVTLLKEKMIQYGIKVSSIGSPIGKIKVTDDFETHFAMFQRVVNIAAELETKYIRIFSFYHDNGSEWTNEEKSEVIARLRKMVDYAREYDVVLLHENENDTYGNTADRCADLMQELFCDHFKSVFDPANFVQSGQDAKYAYDILKEYIAYMHIKDACFKDRGVVPAGMGDGNVEYILKDLFVNGYDGFLSLEPHLFHFEKLSALGLDDKMLDLPQNGEGTFTLAYRILCELLNKV